MPLRDHFRSPLDDTHSWDELHGMLPAVIVQQLFKILPEPYFAAPRVHLGSLYEVTLALEPELPNQDTYEVRIYDSRRNRRLVAAIEIVGPSNKDRPEHRDSFVSKVATLVKNNICVSVVDVVTTMDSNLYAELMRLANAVDPVLGDDPPPVYAATLRTRHEQRRILMDTWYHRLAVGQTLPKLPIWLRETFAVPLDLESSYEETCRTLRIR